MPLREAHAVVDRERPRTSPTRLLTVEMVLLVLPCAILWVMMAPAMGWVLVKTGPAGFDSWLPLWLGGGLVGLTALWSAHFDQMSDRQARLKAWQWAGLAIGIVASLSVVIPSLSDREFPLPAVLRVVIASPVVAAIRIVTRQTLRRLSSHSATNMDRLRRTLGAILAALGVYYCVLGGFVLAQLPSVTRQWIERSGDQDFTHDYELFLALTGIGAALLALLGWRTAVKGLANLRGRWTSWTGPAIAAWPLHLLWLFYRILGTGSDGFSEAALTSGVQFGVVCAGYLVLWSINRRPVRATTTPGSV